jgi:outer membrane protein
MRPVVLAFIVLAWCGPAAHAQDDPAVVLTPDEAIARALAHSQRLAEAEARAAAAEASVESRRAAERPALSVSAGYTRTNHVDEFGVPQPDGRLRVIYPDIPDNYFTRATLQWPIYTAGRTDALIRAADAEARATAADVRVARADLRLEVVRAFWALVTATESVAVFEDALTRADAHLGDVRSRFENGLIPPNEVASVEAQRARQQMLLIEARNFRSSVLEDLRRLTGITADITVPRFSGSSRGFSTPVPTGVLPGGSAGGSRTEGSRTEGSRTEGSRTEGSQTEGSLRAEQEALRARLAAADERIEAVRAGRKPTVSFLAGADYANPNPRIFPRADRWQTSWDVGVVASWAVWDGGRVAAEAAEADAAARALRARQADLDALITTEVRQRRLDLDSAHAALEAAEVAVRSADEARRIVSERFTVGVATSTDVLDAQLALLQAELDRTRALANIRLAEARLDRAEGREGR